MFGELTENLTSRRNNQLLKKVRSLATVTCAYPGPGQHAEASCAFSKTVARSQFILHEGDVNTLSTGRCLSGRPINVAIKTTRPDNNYRMWCDNKNYCNQLPVHPHYQQQKPTRARTFPLARYMIQSNFPPHFFPCISVMMVTCYNVSFRQLLLMLTFVGISHHKLV